MLKYIRKHLQSNRGDAHVSKMTMIAIVFVVGAILLVMTTSAFRNPVNNWFQKVTTGWFADENGMFEADNRFLGYQKNANGTYQGVMYRCEDNAYFHKYTVLQAPELLQNGADASEWVRVTYYKEDGTWYSDGDVRGAAGTVVTISEDGTRIQIGNRTFEAYIPE